MASKKHILPVLVLASLTMGLVSCGGNPSSSSSKEDPITNTSTVQPTSDNPITDVEPSSSVDPIEYGVSVTNKADFEEMHYNGDKVRLSISLTPTANALAEVNAGNLVITSSNKDVATIEGINVVFAGEGKTTIKLTYHNASDEFEVEGGGVLSNKIKFGIDHEGTEEDPLTNGDAYKVGLWTKDNGGVTTEFYIKGVVERFYNAPGSRDDGMVAFYLEKEANDGGQFEVYKCFGKDEAKLTDDDIWVGAEVVVTGVITYYAGANQPETSSATLISVSGEKPADPINIDASVADALKVGKELADGASTWDYYTVTGFAVLKDSSNNVFLADSADASTADTKALYEIYRPSEDALKILLKGAKVSVKAKLKNYHGQVENGSTPEVTLITAGEPWDGGDIPDDPVEVKSVTVAEGIAAAKELPNGEISSAKYAVKGIIRKITRAFNAQYGNISFTIVDAAEDTDTLTVFNLPVSEARSAALVEGNTVELVGNLQNYYKNEVNTYELVNATLGNVSDVTGAHVVNYGTNEKPITVGELLVQAEDIVALDPANNVYSTDKVAVLGVVTSASYSSSYGNWTIEIADAKNPDLKIKATGALLDQTITTVAGNDQIVINDYLEAAKTYWAFYVNNKAKTNPLVVSRVVGNSEIKIEAEHATVNGIEAKKYENDVELQFTVEAEEGYSVESVALNGKALTPEEGVYKFTVAGDTVITVSAVSDEANNAEKVTFNLGDDNTQSPVHKDGDAAEKYTETVGEYTLDITDVAKFYTGATDNKGNGCIKLGTAKVVGSFTINVPAGVKEVNIAVAGYKTYETKISINGGDGVVVSTLSDDGEYTTLKATPNGEGKVTFTTVSSSYRCMINTIEFVL